MLSKLLDEFIDARSDEIDKYGLIVFDKSNWTIEYTEEERTYIFRNDDKFFWLSNFQKYIVVCVGEEDEKVAKRNLY